MTWEVLGGTTANQQLGILAAKAVEAPFPEVGGSVDLAGIEPNADVLAMFRPASAAPAATMSAELKH